MRHKAQYLTAPYQDDVDSGRLILRDRAGTLGRSRQLGRGARAAYAFLRDAGIAALVEDRYLETDLDSADAILHGDEFVPAVEQALGEPLE